MKSIFTDKNNPPSVAALSQGLGDSFAIWNRLEDFTKQQYPTAMAEWHFSGEKFGWSFRIKDSKRVIIYLLPREHYFKAAFVFGQKATDHIAASDLSDSIKSALMAAKPYAEGRGIRIDVTDSTIEADIQKLIAIKIAH